MSILLRGRVWHVHLEIKGQVVRQSLRTGDKKEATRRAKDIEKTLLEGTYKEVTTQSQHKMTLGEAWEYLWHTHYVTKKDSKGVNFKYITLSKFMDPQTPLEAITRARIDQLVLDMSKATYSNGGAHRASYAPATINRILSLISFILNRMCDAGHIDHVPKIIKAKESSRTLTLSNSQQDDFYDCLRDSPNVNHQHALDAFEFLLATGCRVGEVLQLKWDNIDLHSNRLLLHDTKSGHAVTKPLTARAVEILQQSQSEARSAPFSHVTRATLRGAWDYARSELKFDPALVPHSLRHTVASRLIESGIGTQLVKDFLGHKSIQTTQRYVHLNVDSLSPIVNVLDALNDTTATQAVKKHK